MTRSRATEFDQSLFGDGVELPPRFPPRNKAKPPRSVAQGKCPHHTSDTARTLTGLVRGGKHLYWKPHWVNRYGSRAICIASDSPLCSTPAIETEPNHPTPKCPCLKGSKASATQ